MLTSIVKQAGVVAGVAGVLLLAAPAYAGTTHIASVSHKLTSGNSKLDLTNNILKDNTVEVPINICGNAVALLPLKNATVAGCRG